jgi:small-conductance mechanosensitive channel
MAEEKVNVQIPASRVPGILSLYQEWSRGREATIEEMHRGLDGAIQAIERRIAFFDRLILLAGGSFALSLTFVSTLHKAPAQNVHYVSVGCLKAAWVSMLLCIVFSWIHNWYRCTGAENVYFAAQQRVSSFQHQVNAGFADRASGLFEGVTAEDVNFGEFFALLKSYYRSESEKADSGVEQTRKDAMAVLVRATWIGNLALLSVVVSFVLLLVFALRNSAFL